MLGRLKSLISSPAYGWFGHYETWNQASAMCTNYDAEHIFNKVRNAALAVKNGEAAFERDSVLFHEPEYNWQLLSSLLWIFTQPQPGPLTILDFGGSFGSSYYQHRSWLQNKSFTWNVVEQAHFVTEGQKSFEDQTLKFYHTVEEVKSHSPSLLILSSVLPYLEDPYAWLSKLLALKFDYIFLDRAPLVPSGDRLTIQKVPKEIYEGSYPAWFFDKQKFMNLLLADYTIMAEFANEEKASFVAEFKGFFLIKK